MGENTAGKVVVNSVIYSASGLLLKCFTFFLLPLYTAYLSTDEYGINSIAISFISTMGFVVAFSLFSAVMRFYVDLKEDKEKLKRFYGTISLFTFLSGICFFILLYILRDFIRESVFSGIDFYPIVFLCLIALVFYCQQMIFDNILKSQQRAAMSSILNMVFFFITLIFNVVFVVVLKQGAAGTVLATTLSYFLYTVFFVVYMIIKKQIKYCLDFKLLKSALKYSIPILPHNLSTQIAQLISKVLIGDVVSLGSLGIYTVASQFGNISDTIQTYVDNAYGPWLYEKLHDKEEGYKTSIRATVKMLIGVIGFFFLSISLFAHDYIILFVAKEYIDAWQFVPIIVITFAIKTAYYFYVEVLFFYKSASRYLFISTLSSSIINVLLSYFLIPQYGVIGSIAADAIAMIIRVAIIVWISKRFDNIGLFLRDFLWNLISISIFIFLGMSPTIFIYKNGFSLINFSLKVFIIIIYALLIYMQNRNQMRPFVQKITSIVLQKRRRSSIEKI